MKNLLTFYGSCGHITIEEIDKEEWDEVSKENYTINCEDDLVRMIYVHPTKFFACQDCVEEEAFCGEFETLRYFFHNYEPKELLIERDAQTITLGKSMLPFFNEEKILRIASKVEIDL